MAQLYVIGRVTADFDLQTSSNMNPYVRFGLAEKVGYGDAARTQFMQVWAWGNNAKHLIKGKVKKGSLIWIAGSLELEEFTKQDGITTDKRLKVALDKWGYIPVGKTKQDDTPPDDEPEAESPPDFPPDGEIDGDRDDLPD